MGTPQAQNSAGRREDIVAAALACFAAKGVTATTIADIRVRSGASTGSIYHHFGDKDGVAGRVYLAVLRQYQESHLTGLKRCRTAEDAVTSSVRHYLNWVVRNADAARLLNDMRRVPQVMAADADIRAETRQFLDAAHDIFAGFIKRGELRDVPAHVLPALLVGPCAAVAQRWLEGGARGDLSREAQLLGDAAWRALKPQSNRGKRKPR